MSKIDLPVNGTHLLFDDGEFIRMLLKFLKSIVKNSEFERFITFIPYCIHIARKQKHDNPEFKVIERCIFRMYGQVVISVDWSNRKISIDYLVNWGHLKERWTQGDD